MVTGLLTYASGLKASWVVWIAERFTEEHRAALDWLNEITGDDFRFFGFEVEAWRIGDSKPAPKFNLVSKPNEWSKDIRKLQASGNFSETQKMRLAYWTAFKENMEKSDSSVRCQKPHAHGYMRMSIGKTGVHLEATMSTWNPLEKKYEKEIRAELIIQNPNPLERYSALESQKENIETELGENLVWHAPDETTQRRIYLRRSVESFEEGLWADQHEWLKAKLEGLDNAFRGRVAKLS